MITTIVMLVSRSDYLDEVFNSLNELLCDIHRTNLVVLVDGIPSLYIDVRNRVQESKFAERLCISYSKKKPPKWNIGARRLRIARLHNELKKHIPISDYIFGIEDDTLIPPDALIRLRSVLQHEPNVGISSGVEVGRWGMPYIGAWLVDDINEPRELRTIDLGKSGLQSVDATGFYCFVTRYKLYISHEFSTFERNSLGADVEFGLSLRKRGYNNYVDWRVICGHFNKRGELLLPDNGVRNITFKKAKQTWRLT
jgi:hypothetical protein